MTSLDEDIFEVIRHKNYFQPLENSTILITGATGLIGSFLIKSFLQYGHIKIYAACRNRVKFEKIFANYMGDNLIPIVSDILDLNIKDISIDYIIHGASVTDSKSFIDKPIETIDIALDGTRNILKQCINKNIKAFIYLSSLEVYGTFNNLNEIKNVTEKEFGYIDTMSIRSSYSEGKRMVENICKAYNAEYDIPIRVVRLCQTFGAGVEYDDNRVFAQFGRAILENRNIILRTKGETVRNYCYTSDAITGILTVMIKGSDGEVYNIANMDTTISIIDMAKLICSLRPETNCSVVFDIAEDVEKLGYNPVVKIQLDSTKLMNLGWKPVYNMEQMLSRLLKGMSDDKENHK